MVASNRDKRTAIVEGLFCYIAALGAAIAIFGVGGALGVNSGRQEVSAREHYEHVKDRAVAACVERGGLALSECVTDAVEDSQEQSDSRQDLYAQRDMVLWAAWMVYLTAAALAATIVGIIFVKRTLDATVSAVEETTKATKAMDRQNELAQSAQRAWVGVEAQIVSASGTDVAFSIHWRVIFRNLGKTMAREVSYRAEILPKHRKTILQEISQELEDIQLSRDTIASAIIPDDDVWLGGDFNYKIRALPWDDTGAECYIIIVARADYLIEGDTKPHTSARAFTIGFKDKDMFSQRSFQPQDFTLGLQESRLTIYPMGPTIAT